MQRDLWDVVRALEHDRRLFKARDEAIVRKANPMAPAESRRDAGIAAAANHATQAWRNDALGWVVVYAAIRKGARFLAEDVREYAQASGFAAPPDGRAWGRIMRTALYLGYIVADGTLPAKSSNLSPKVAWRQT